MLNTLLTVAEATGAVLAILAGFVLCALWIFAETSERLFGE